MTTLSDLFGQGRSTCSTILNQVTAAINEHLTPQKIYWPSADQMHIVMASFEKQYGIVQCVGLIDDTHIPIKRPVQDGDTYFNRKHYYSLNVEG